MGTASKFLSIVLRLLEFSFAAVILGIIATFLHYIRNDGMAPESRLIYGITLAAISIVASIALFWPAKYSFYAFPLDFILFVMWIVCFALLEALSGNTTCRSAWFRNYWSTHWGGNWLMDDSAAAMMRRGCQAWQVVLALSFIIAMTWFLSGCLSLYVCIEHLGLNSRFNSHVNRLPKRRPLEDGAPQDKQQQRN